MIPGDGVGPEIMDSVQNVVKSVGAPIDFEVMHLSEVICFHFYTAQAITAAERKREAELHLHLFITLLQTVIVSCWMSLFTRKWRENSNLVKFDRVNYVFLSSWSLWRAL